MNTLSDCFGHVEKGLSGEDNVSNYHQSCVMPTVKDPETIHVWACFSAKVVDSLTILPKNTAMKKNGANTSSESTFSQPSRNSLVTNNAFSSMIEHLQLQALIMQEWAAISQNLTQKFIDSMPGRIADVLKKKGKHCKY
jgi:hypothetical protein